MWKTKYLYQTENWQKKVYFYFMKQASVEQQF